MTRENFEKALVLVKELDFQTEKLSLLEAQYDSIPDKKPEILEVKGVWLFSVSVYSHAKEPPQGVDIGIDSPKLAKEILEILIKHTTDLIETLKSELESL